MEREEIIAKAVDWMARRGWKEKLAKRRGSEQSLFEHSLIELDVFLELRSILSAKAHYGLNDIEQQTLVAAIFMHDVGKETEVWQRFISGQGPRVPHIIPELTRALVPEVCRAFGFDVGEQVERTIAHCAEFHHNRPGRSDGAIFSAMQTDESDRFQTLADLVKAIDHFCSASQPDDALVTARRESALNLHLAFACHRVAIRGVSSAFLHGAAHDAFEKLGWKRLLIFPEGTVYGGDPIGERVIPTSDEIRDLLKTEIDRGIARDVTPLMVGSPTGNILPKPDLLAFSESRQYLQSAAKKISPKSFAKKKLTDKRRVVEEYWRLKGRSDKPTDLEVEHKANEISSSQPEMIVFKFFKAMMDPDKVKEVEQEGATLAGQLYEEIFGVGSWAALQSTSTLMPAKDMAKTVDYFWALPGSKVDRPQNESVATVSESERTEGLISLLDEIAKKVYASTNKPSPRERLSSNMAEAFIKDLQQPSPGGDPRLLSEKQLEHYARSKPFAGKETGKGVYFCPICNTPFDPAGGQRASADFIDNPQTHTNRGIAYGGFGYVMVCSVCYYERLLFQVLLGTRPAQVITLMPRLNIGPAQGKRLVAAVKEWVEEAQGLMRGKSETLDYGFSLGLTDLAARKLTGRDAFEVQPEDLSSLFTYRFGADTQKKRRQEALKRLKQEFGDEIGEFNSACEQVFSSWDEAVEALIENRIDLPEIRAIRREVFRLYETIHLICQTPNLIFIPLTYEIASGNEESATSKGFRRLFVSLLLSIVLESAVAIHQEGEPVDFQGRSGSAYVPPIPAVRALVGHDWVPLNRTKYWLTAIGAASLLVRATGLPERSALYQILSADPAERLAQRIHEARKTKSGLSQEHLLLIEELPGFHRGEKEA
jgi:hypothetical protein